MIAAEAISEEVKQKHARELDDAVKGAPRNGAVPKLLIPVLTPTLGQVSMWWATSVMDLLWPMNTGKQVMPVMDNEGGLIAEIRNRAIGMCLAMEEHHQTKVHSVLWLDDDVIVNRTALCALASHDADIAAGVYFCKGDFGAPLIFPGPSGGTSPFRPNEVFESWGYAQGLSLVKLDVYRRMRDELDLGLDKFGQPNWYKNPEMAVDEKTGGLVYGGTEDFHFFANAEKLGIKPIVDCRSVAFGFHYDSGLRTGFPRQQWEQFVRREPIVWPATKHNEEVVWR